MHFTIFVALAALASFTVTAAPTGPIKAALFKRVDGHVYICTDSNFGGDCTNYGFTNNVCSNLPSEFQDDISSFGPDKGWSCTMYTDPDCTGAVYSATNPGTTLVPGFLNDSFSSLRCVPT
ncbi:Short chain dehydrogenase [Mycena venus]|uniref:Short chain dehydrogenase n=1 Tax=Mycena venus TaxID=2733690 RepID=A0A8H6XQY7_9AGAR|nr:Short chain dehydrogenase [Mycena venus]